MKFRKTPARPLLIGLAVLMAIAACDETLDSGAACPALCPTRPDSAVDTTFAAVAMDTSLAGFPAFGRELHLYIATLGDTLETNGIVRFDSLPKNFRHNGTVEDSTIVFVDTGSVVRFSLIAGDTLRAPLTVEAYDVDMGGAEDSDPSAVGAGFTPSRLLGTVTYDTGTVQDSVVIPIPPDSILARIQADAPGNRLRIGIRATAPNGQRAHLTAVSSNGVTTYGRSGPLLIFRPSADTTVPKVTMFAYSAAPDANTPADTAATDYLYIAKSPPPPPSDVLRIGGIPGRRTYLTFNIPSRILDSSRVLRATLLLTQRPNRFSAEPTDSVGFGAVSVTASPVIQDLMRALLFVAGAGADTLRVAPADSGLRQLELVRQMRAWRGTSPSHTRRALALAVTQEVMNARAIDFFSTEAPASVQPRVRITYIPPPGTQP